MITIEKTDEITIFRVSGEVTGNDIVAQAVQYMRGEPTRSSMWDFTQTSELKLTTLEMQGIADSLKKVAKGDAVRKVALVSSKTINIGLGKLFGAFAQMAKLPYTYKTFRNRDHALAWLASESE